MSNIIVLTDSTCDLSKEILDSRNIMVMPFRVFINEETYLDGVDIDSEKFFEKVEEKNVLPKTAAATLDQYMETFENLTKDGSDVIFCGIGGKLSSAYQNILVALQNCDESVNSHVFVVDSMNLSTGIGLTLLKICDMRDQGLSAKEIKEKADEITPRVRAQFCVKDLTMLHKGGRCSGTAKFFGTMLRIRPILRVFDGTLLLDDKIFGRYEKALDYQIEDITNALKDVDDEYLFITHALADEEAEYIYANLPEAVKKKFKHIYITKAGCVIASHCGRHTIGILYIKKSHVVRENRD